jgi:hypothetical protein
MEKLHNKELHNLYCSLNVIIMIWPEHVAHIGEKSNAYRVLMEKPEGKRPPGGPGHRFECGIKMN